MGCANSQPTREKQKALTNLNQLEEYSKMGSLKNQQTLNANLCIEILAEFNAEKAINEVLQDKPKMYKN